jgi:hypothetical protein
VAATLFPIFCSNQLAHLAVWPIRPPSSSLEQRQATATILALRRHHGHLCCRAIDATLHPLSFPPPNDDAPHFLPSIRPLMPLQPLTSQPAPIKACPDLSEALHAPSLPPPHSLSISHHHHLESRCHHQCAASSTPPKLR